MGHLERALETKQERIESFATFGINAESGRSLHSIELSAKDADKILKALRKLKKLTERQTAK